MVRLDSGLVNFLWCPIMPFVADFVLFAILHLFTSVYCTCLLQSVSLFMCEMGLRVVLCVHVCVSLIFVLGHC